MSNHWRPEIIQEIMGLFIGPSVCHQAASIGTVGLLVKGHWCLVAGNIKLQVCGHASQSWVVYPPAGSRPMEGRWPPYLHSSEGLAVAHLPLSLQSHSRGADLCERSVLYFLWDVSERLTIVMPHTQWWIHKMELGGEAGLGAVPPPRVHGAETRWGVNAFSWLPKM